MRTTRTAWLVSCLGGLCALLASVDAHAEEPGINPTGKGITGGALLGAEAVMSVEAVAGVKPAWAYLLGGGLGAVGGGIGGYYVEQGDDPKPSYYLLAAGMALIIPTTVAVLQSTSYRPPAEYVEDRPGRTTPATEPAQGEPATAPASPQTTPLPGQPPASRAPTEGPAVALSLVDLRSSGVRLGLPVPEVRPMYSTAEVRRYGVEQRTEVRVPVFQATF